MGDTPCSARLAQTGTDSLALPVLGGRAGGFWVLSSQSEGLRVPASCCNGPGLCPCPAEPRGHRSPSFPSWRPRESPPCR